MTIADEAQPAASGRTGLIRLGVGLAQGLALYGLQQADQHKVWPATTPWLNAALALAAGFVPLIVLAGFGTLRRLTLIVWTLGAALVVAMLAGWDVSRDSVTSGGAPKLIADFPVMLFSAAFLFIAHHLIAPADQVRRPIAPYPAYFDTAWKHGVQLILSIAFTGVFWILLFLGAELFRLIGLTFLHALITKGWFAMPASGVVFAGAVHLTDVRAGVTRGIRTVALVLLSWLLPVMTLIAVGFLAALPFTGLEPLWKIGRSTAILLSASAALIVLLNAAYQDGSEEARANPVLRWTGRATALALLPLIAIAAYGLHLRIGQHGLTPERIIAAACLVVGAIYAVGYAVAAVLPGPWMKRLEPTNVADAFVILAVILWLFSPVGDPGRWSTDDQIARLKDGRTAADRFDYGFLRFGAGDYGRAALKRLAASHGGKDSAAIAAGAAKAAAASSRWELTTLTTRAPDLGARIRLHPAGARLPDGFAAQAWPAGAGPCALTPDGQTCDAWLIDVDRDGRPEVVVEETFALSIYAADGKGGWRALGTASACGDRDAVHKAIQAGPIGATPSRLDDLKAGSIVFRITPECQAGSAEGLASPQPKRSK